MCSDLHHFHLYGKFLVVSVDHPSIHQQHLKPKRHWHTFSRLKIDQSSLYPRYGENKHILTFEVLDEKYHSTTVKILTSTRPINMQFRNKTNVYVCVMKSSSFVVKYSLDFTPLSFTLTGRLLRKLSY